MLCLMLCLMLHSALEARSANGEPETRRKRPTIAKVESIQVVYGLDSGLMRVEKKSELDIRTPKPPF